MAWSHWTPAWYSEIEPFACAVLAQRHPDTPNLGDMTAPDFIDRAKAQGAIDVLVGGTPCQSFSVAGLRGGLEDARGNLALRFLRVADGLRPEWVVWENVPGVLSSGGGRDFGSILGGLVQLGYGFAYRVLDAQYFGLAQRRKRVFVVGYLGDWRRAASVLLERQSLSGHPAPSREAGEGVAPSLASRSTAGGGLGTDFDCDGGLVTGTIGSNGRGAGEDGTGRGTPLVPVGFHTNARADEMQFLEDQSGPITRGQVPGVMAFQPRIGRNGRGYSESVVPALNGADAGATSDMRPCVALQMNFIRKPRIGEQSGTLNAAPGNAQFNGVWDRRYGVRRFTPRECERLQGFPDKYTLVNYRGKPAADGPRYRALGNSMAVPVMRWIGDRIARLDGGGEVR